jgi:hypothetical protein
MGFRQFEKWYRRQISKKVSTPCLTNLAGGSQLRHEGLLPEARAFLNNGFPHHLTTLLSLTNKSVALESQPTNTSRSEKERTDDKPSPTRG